MAEQLPIPVGIQYILPPLSIDDGVLQQFSSELNDRLNELEKRFFVPRRHPRLFFNQSRMAPRKPR